MYSTNFNNDTSSSGDNLSKNDNDINKNIINKSSIKSVNVIPRDLINKSINIKNDNECIEKVQKSLTTLTKRTSIESILYNKNNNINTTEWPYKYYKLRTVLRLVISRRMLQIPIIISQILTWSSSQLILQSI